MSIAGRNLLKAMVIILAGAVGTGEASAQSRWGGAWGYATSPALEQNAPTRPAGTYRYRLRPTQSGDAVRLTFTNPENAVPLPIASVTIGRASAKTGYAVDASEAKTVKFSGNSEARIAANTALTSDPAPLAIKSGQDLVVTIVTSGPSTDVPGNAGFPSEFANGKDGTTEAIASRPYLSLMLVRNPSANCTIVTLGDSITEGAKNREPAWRGWPGRLARRLIEQSPASHCGVVNMGISGNRLLRYGRGAAAVDRFGRDVASIPGATHVVVLEGINDIARSTLATEKPITSADLIAGYQRIIAMAHARGIKAIGATMTPGWGSKYITRDLEKIRAETNRWIRTSGAFDGVIDFEPAVGDKAERPAFIPAFDSGDNLHPGDAGYAAMADAVPLDLFVPVKPSAAASPGKAQ